MQISRKFEFDAAHRVLNHESKCKHLHGHRYVVEVFVEHRQHKLDELDRVIDFGALKSAIGGHINEFYDHNAMFNSLDPFARLAPSYGHGSEQRFDLFTKMPKIFYECNPTAEIIAVLLLSELTEVVKLLDQDLDIVKLVLNETPTCAATVDLSDLKRWRTVNHVSPTNS